MKLKLILAFVFFSMSVIPSLADGVSPKKLSGLITDPLVEAQEKLMHAKGSYKTIRQQESAIVDMRKATKLALRAAKLRAKAEKLQNKADMLVNRANQQALSRGLYVTNPLAPVMMEPPPGIDETAKAASIVPVPGQPINIIVPRQEDVSYNEENENNAPQPILNNF